MVNEFKKKAQFSQLQFKRKNTSWTILDAKMTIATSIHRKLNSKIIPKNNNNKMRVETQIKKIGS